MEKDFLATMNSKTYRGRTKTTLAILPILCLFFLIGCASNVLLPTSICQPLSAFDTIIIAPMNIDSTLVEEAVYNHLPKHVTLHISDKLKDKLENSHSFKKILISTDCAEKAIKVESKIDSFIHSGGEFHVMISGRILNCQSGECLYKFKIKNARNIQELPDIMASRIATGINAKLTCQ